MDSNKVYKEWLLSKNLNDDIKKELISIDGKDQEIYNRFHKNLEFGTGGLRALIGAGTNRLNIYTVRRISLGYGRFLINEYGENAKARGVIIAYDVRHFSYEFSLEVAKVLSSLGIKTSFFESSTTTPELSFFVREYGAIGGVVITASHNPPEYNGYKIYDGTGCQVTVTLANKIISEIDKIKDFSDVESITIDNNLVSSISDKERQIFVNTIIDSQIDLLKIAKEKNDLKVLYTPLHGTGGKPIFYGLKRLGLNEHNIYSVEEQVIEDPNFSSVVSPNPEDIQAFEMALKEGKENNVDVIVGTDPDCDRMGAIVRHGEAFVILNGNEIGALLTYYLITTNMEVINSMKNPYLVKTIVTSELGASIARKNGVEVYNTLTGFKYIGEKINNISKHGNFLLGYEESYGFLLGEFIRDKDGIGTTLKFIEMVAHYKNEDRDLIDILNEIYDKFGFYKEELYSIILDGLDGEKKVETLMCKFRNLNIDNNGNLKLVKVEDFLNNIHNLPKSNVIKVYFDNDSWIAVRPSGTEPKIKFYMGVHENSEIEAEKSLDQLKVFVDTIIDESGTKN